MIKLIKRLLFVFIIVVLVICAGFGTLGYIGYKNAIDEVPLSEKVSEIENREHYVSVDNVSEYFKDAIVAIEDHRFYTHHGIDYIALIRVTFANMMAQDILGGGSTITQQLAKNMYYDQSQSMTRKVSEAFSANELENNYSKDEILSLYINAIYYGDGYYGIYEASMGYFGVEPSQLSLAQASMLAGLPQAPSVYALSTNFSAATQRQEEVLNAMLEHDYITKDEYTQALAVDLR